MLTQLFFNRFACAALCRYANYDDPSYKTSPGNLFYQLTALNDYYNR